MPSIAPHEIVLGSIWKTHASGSAQFVLVLASGTGTTPTGLGAAPVRQGFVTLCAVTEETHAPVPEQQLIFAKPSRFNGKRGGYTLHQNPLL